VTAEDDVSRLLKLLGKIACVDEDDDVDFAAVDVAAQSKLLAAATPLHFADPKQSLKDSRQEQGYTQVTRESSWTGGSGREKRGFLEKAHAHFNELEDPLVPVSTMVRSEPGDEPHKVDACRFTFGGLRLARWQHHNKCFGVRDKDMDAFKKLLPNKTFWLAPLLEGPGCGHGGGGKG
jgi:hypothetical protein